MNSYFQEPGLNIEPNFWYSAMWNLRPHVEATYYSWSVRGEHGWEETERWITVFWNWYGNLTFEGVQKQFCDIQGLTDSHQHCWSCCICLSFDLLTRKSTQATRDTVVCVLCWKCCTEMHLLEPYETETVLNDSKWPSTTVAMWCFVYTVIVHWKFCNYVVLIASNCSK